MQEAKSELRKIGDLPIAFKVALAGCAILSLIEVLVLFQQLAVVKIDSGLATLVGAIVGLCVVAWQTGQGFKNLIRSQENQAQIAREARLHQAELEQEAMGRQQQQDRATLLGSLRAEIASLFGAVTDAQKHVWTLALIAKAIKKSGQSPSTKVIALHTFEAPVFKASISNLGILGANLGADVIRVLSKANGKEVKFQQEIALPHDVVITLYEGNHAALEKWASDLYHVAMRIRAAEDGTPDPGTLVETQDERYAELKPKIPDP